MTSVERRSTLAAARGNRRSIRGGCRWKAGAAVAALGLMLALAGPRPAEAQFICGGSGTGAEPQTADGAAVAGAGTVACGTNAAATGNLTTAVGANAAATGSGTTAVGNAAGFLDNPGNIQNSFFGSGTGAFVNGSNNSAFGTQDTGRGVTGSNNSAYGSAAGRFVTGSNNVAMGNNAGSGTSANPLVMSNTVAVGNNAVAGADGATAI